MKLAGGLALLALVASGASAPSVECPAVRMAETEPLALAEAIIAKDPMLLILDLPAQQPEGGTERIPGSIAMAADMSAVEVLSATAAGTAIVVYDERGLLTEVPSAWPAGLDYRMVKGGFAGWRKDVLTPAQPVGFSVAEREFVERQNQMAAFFSGAAVRPSAVIAPPVVRMQGPPKKKAMGC